MNKPVYRLKINTTHSSPVGGGPVPTSEDWVRREAEDQLLEAGLVLQLLDDPRVEFDTHTLCELTGRSTLCFSTDDKEAATEYLFED